VNDIDDRPGSDIAACTDPAHIDGCPGRAGGEHKLRKIEIVSMGTIDAQGRRSYADVNFGGIGFLPVPATGISMQLQDGRVITIGDLGNGPVVQVLGPDAETLLERPLPPVVEREAVWCNLRGQRVPEEECVGGCPAPEQRDVCIMLSKARSAAPLGGIEQYQAEDR